MLPMIPNRPSDYEDELSALEVALASLETQVATVNDTIAGLALTANNTNTVNVSGGGATLWQKTVLDGQSETVANGLDYVRGDVILLVNGVPSSWDFALVKGSQTAFDSTLKLEVLANGDFIVSAIGGDDLDVLLRFISSPLMGGGIVGPVGATGQPGADGQTGLNGTSVVVDGARFYYNNFACDANGWDKINITSASAVYGGHYASNNNIKIPTNGWYQINITGISTVSDSRKVVRINGLPDISSVGYEVPTPTSIAGRFVLSWSGFLEYGDELDFEIFGDGNNAYTADMDISIVRYAPAIPTSQGIVNVSGVIRSTGGVWDFIDDAKHTYEPNNMTVTQDANYIYVNYGPYTKTLSFVIATDETYAQLGYRCGSSVATYQARVKLFNASGTLSHAEPSPPAYSNLWFIGRFIP